MTAEIDVMKNSLYVVKDGQVIAIEPPASGFGDQVAVWINGKVDRVDTTVKQKL
ncbi:DUF3954 domain-containing protein [Alkalihalobacillus sp. LMS39]|uniref:DUF3954 domain-containing protein n=1 Tax=Alkalihalobacillus sp. LMS39 TaxID=2924032 RepID=UPI001FB48F4D|nr:DUF3954 domain-containing protein [Alkalihalobacillus sp. LMS39]UOE96401.1 DUF3954 domain-containing protein [Alkalihalobacillus sp. LMS39]